MGKGIKCGGGSERSSSKISKTYLFKDGQFNTTLLTGFTPSTSYVPTTQGGTTLTASLGSNYYQVSAARSSSSGWSRWGVPSTNKVNLDGYDELCFDYTYTRGKPVTDLNQCDFVITSADTGISMTDSGTRRSGWIFSDSTVSGVARINLSGVTGSRYIGFVHNLAGQSGSTSIIKINKIWLEKMEG